jgi:hypothetical protein
VSLPAERLGNYQIGTTSKDPSGGVKLDGYNVCATHAGEMGAAETKTFACSVTDQYVIVQLKGKNYLTLCEVEVFESKLISKLNKLRSD